MDKKINKQLQTAWNKRNKLRAEGDKLWAEGSKLRAEGNKLVAEGDKLYAEGSKLYAEGDIIFINKILSVLGNVEMEWKDRGCLVDGKYQFKE